MEWISITKKTPPFHKQVIFRGKITWKSKNQISFFNDELTTEQESLDYGKSAYLLKDNTDYLVSEHPNVDEICDQFVTHWCEIPVDLI